MSDLATEHSPSGPAPEAMQAQARQVRESAEPILARLWLRLRAPFAAYRPMQAGSLRATLPTMPYSAAWGLALNLAGIDTRAADADAAGPAPDPVAPVASFASATPCLRLCLGLTGPPAAIATLLQHAHGYPVGRASAHLARGAHGAKYHIAPVRRELLVDLDLALGIDGAPPVIARLRAGLAGAASWPRHGLPFAGDNNLLFDTIAELPAPPPARWYVPAGDPALRPVARLHVAIDRADSSRTRTREVAPLPAATADPPDAAWTWTPRPPFMTGGTRTA
jgi:CRISPR-associated protein Cas5t